MIKTVSLDLHDWSILNNRLDLLMKLREHYPGFKVSLFTIPYDAAYEMNVQARIHRKGSLKAIKEHLSWMELIPHGLAHVKSEFANVAYHDMRDLLIPAIEEFFADDGLPYAKGFCAPYWLWNKDVCKALNEAGWWGAVDRNQPLMARTNKVYVYTHSLEEPFWLSTDETLNLHGHIDGRSDNDLEKCFLNLFKLPGDVEWKFASEFVQS